MATEAEMVAAVERDAKVFAASLKTASEAGVSEALLFPAVVGVFHAAGMVPESFDLGTIMGMFT